MLDFQDLSECLVPVWENHMAGCKWLVDYLGVWVITELLRYDVTACQRTVSKAIGDENNISS